MANAAVWLGQLMAEFTNSEEAPMLLYEDNQSAIAMSKNPQFQGRAKHMT